MSLLPIPKPGLVIPGSADKYEYGMLPPGLFEQLREGILTRQKERLGRIISRNEE